MSDNKFRESIIALHRAREDFESLSKQIGIHLKECIDAQVKSQNKVYYDIEPHLKEAYRMEIEGYESVFANDDPEFYLEQTCQHCLKAHYLIQERKIAKQKLGRARAWITRLGKKAANEFDKGA